MSDPVNLASSVADRLRQLAPPWDVFAERSRRFEIHLTGSRVELTRGPMVLEGFGVRVLRARDDQTGVGFRASTEFSAEAIRAAVEDAERLSRFNQFPAKRPELPAPSPSSGTGGKIVDAALWADPARALERFAAALVAAFDGRKGAVPSFSSIRATLTETSIANSAGLSAAYAHTVAETEVAVKAFGGPEGRAPAEYWVTEAACRLDPASLPVRVEDWVRYAEDARRASSPPNGTLPVAFPPEVLAEILPAALRFKFTGSAALRGLAVAPGSRLAAEGLDVVDDGTLDWGLGTSPVDDEGTPQRRRRLITGGKATELLYDALHADALGGTTTGSASRVSGMVVGTDSWRRFTRGPGPDISTLVIPPGKGGSDSELIEEVEDGVWVQQIGWAQPDFLTGRFGGEIRIGYRIRHGKLAEPVRGGTVGGAVVAPDGSSSLLHDITAVGSTARLVGRLSCATMLVGSLSVAGDELAARPASG
jgi:predicted Zn-dependent protease